MFCGSKCFVAYAQPSKKDFSTAVIAHRSPQSLCEKTGPPGSDGSCGSVAVRAQNLFAADVGVFAASTLPLLRTTEPTIIYQAVTRGFKARMLSV